MAIAFRWSRFGAGLLKIFVNIAITMTTRRADLTYKHNFNLGRHGWLRLTPAYSVKMVEKMLERAGKPQLVLDPFSGTGTTGLVCAERGIPCHLAEINPFLVWLAIAKTDRYTKVELNAANQLARAAATEARQNKDREQLWIPPLNHIERWWAPERLTALATLFSALQSQGRELGETPALNLALVAFCRVAIQWSNASFNHQSMSFKKSEEPRLFQQNEKDLIVDNFLFQMQHIVESARHKIPGRATVCNGDSRRLDRILSAKYDCVMTSPPYPNRMSYIREVRPYMYWLGFLKEAREAGELDWQAIGGTWGIATSRLKHWQPDNGAISCDGLEEICQEISLRSQPLANYVRKYFIDIATHLDSLSRVLVSGAKIFYAIGNSKFYDTLVPVEQIYANLLEQGGFSNISIEVARKRNSKKELYEFLLSAEWN